MTTDTTSSVPAGDRGIPIDRAPAFPGGTRPPQAPPRTFTVGRAPVRRPGDSWAAPSGRHAASPSAPAYRVPTAPGAHAGREPFTLPGSFARPGRLVPPPDDPRMTWRGEPIDWRRVVVRPGWRRPEASDAPTDPTGGIGVITPAGPVGFRAVGRAAVDPSAMIGRIDTDPSGMVSPFTTDPSGGLSVITRPRTDPAAITRPARRTPSSGRLIAACAWAMVITLVGSVLAVRSCVEVFVGAPGWFLPVSGLVGLLGVGCTVAALCLARIRVVPWTLLGVSTCALGLATYLITLADAARAATGS